MAAGKGDLRTIGSTVNEEHAERITDLESQIVELKGNVSSTRSPSSEQLEQCQTQVVELKHAVANLSTGEHSCDEIILVHMANLGWHSPLEHFKKAAAEVPYVKLALTPKDVDTMVSKGRDSGFSAT